MTDGDARARSGAFRAILRVAAWTIGAGFVVVVLISMTGLVFVIQVPLLLLLGWARFLHRTLPEVSVNAEAVGIAFASLASLAVGGHYFARWLHAQVRGTAGPEGAGWRARWTLGGLALFVLLFASSIATVGLAHQTIWLVRDGFLVKSGAHRQTMADIRTLATAMESYSIDHDAYPEVVGTASQLIPHLEPEYVNQLPTHDGWGSPFLVQSGGSSYKITSHASDRRGSAFREGPSTNPADDIVFADGTFVAWPE